MKYRNLGQTGIDVSSIVMGCWSIGGGFTWGPQDGKICGSVTDRL